jgi:hypothetical protein
MFSRLKENASLAALALAVIAMFIAIGGVAGALPGKNSVDSADIKKNSVKSSDIKNDGVTGTDVKESTLKLGGGALPGINYQAAGPIQYGKDGFGVVHLRGSATGASLGNTFATLPDGFRPSATQLFAAVGGFSSPCAVQVGNDGAVKLFGTGSCNTLVISVDGITFSVG